jgi:hypothetical protein
MNLSENYIKYIKSITKNTFKNTEINNFKKKINNIISENKNINLKELKQFIDPIVFKTILTKFVKEKFSLKHNSKNIENYIYKKISEIDKETNKPKMKKV